MKKKVFKIENDSKNESEYYSHLRKEDPGINKKNIVVTRIYREDADKLRILLNQKNFLQNLQGNTDRILLLDILNEALDDLSKKYTDLIKSNIN